MKKLYNFLILFLMTSFGFSQVGINTTMPNAQLEIKSSNQIAPANTDGILIPKIDAFPLINPTVAQQSMMVYLTTISAGKSPGFYYWDQVTTSWKGIESDKVWTLSGNAGTNPATNFVGTTDDNDLVFRRNNLKSGFISLYNTAFGREALFSNTTGDNNSASGVLALHLNVTGNMNTANGVSSLYHNKAGSNATAIGKGAMENTNNTTVPFDNKNVGVGYEALRGSIVPADNTGNSNTAIGYQSINKNSTGNFNVANGFVSLFSNTTGNFNVANGAAAMYSNTSGYENTASGSASLYTNTSGFHNVANGFDAMYFNTLGSKNIAAGYRSLYNNTIGTDNIANGFEALRANKVASKNVAIGTQALFKQIFTNGGVAYDSENVAIGFSSLFNTNSTTNLNGRANIGIGTYALSNNGSGSSNVAIGSSALGASGTAGGSMTGNNNVAIGSAAIKSLTTGTNNIAIGGFSLGYNTVGDENISIGKDALYYSTSLSGGTAIGTRAMQNYGISGPVGTNDNVAIGFETLKGTSCCPLYNQNTAVGYRVLQAISSGNNNTALGYHSLYSNTTGDQNTAFGNGTLFSNNIGSNNVAIGYQAGFNETGSNKLYIENSNSVTPLIYGEFDNDLLKINGNIKVDNITTLGNEMQIVNKNNYTHFNGNQIFGTGGDDLIISSEEGAGETGGMYADGNAVSIWSPGDANQSQPPALVYFLDEDFFDATNTNPYDNTALKSYITPVGAYVQISDKNKKENIVKIENATEKINQISGYTYQFKLAPEEVKKGDKPIQSSGVLAQEVEKILPQAVQKNQNGDYFVDYAAITPLLIEAIKEQNTKIKVLETMNAEILMRLTKLENK